MERLYEARLAPAARRVLEALPLDQRRELQRLIALIEQDPYPDHEVKVIVMMPPAVLTAYVHPDWWLLYHIAENAHINVLAIGPAWPPPGWLPQR